MNPRRLPQNHRDTKNTEQNTERISYMATGNLFATLEGEIPLVFSATFEKLLCSLCGLCASVVMPSSQRAVPFGPSFTQPSARTLEAWQMDSLGRQPQGTSAN